MRTLVLPSLLAVAVSGCRCDGALATLRPGELVGLDQQGAVTSALALDFGTVLTLETRTLTFTVQNRGQVPLTFEPVTGTGDVAAFTFALPASLGAGESKAVDLTFSPDAVRAFAAQFTLKAGDAVVALGVSGDGVLNRCDVPEQLDFGRVAVGSFRALALELQNPRDEEVEAVVSAPRDNDAASFQRVLPTQNTVRVKAMKRVLAEFSFRPTTPQSFTTRVTVRAAPSCPERSVRLFGTGVNDAVIATPNPLVFGFVPLSASTSRTLTLDSATASPVTVPLAYGQRDYSGPATVTVPAFGSATVPVRFAPGAIGVRNTTMTLTIGTAASIVSLRGSGGGPDIDVRPASLTFGRVAFFGGNTPRHVRKVQVLNVGTNGTTQPDERLFLGTARAAPYVELRGVDGGVASPEFTAQLSPGSTYRDADGLEARAGQFVSVDVGLTPTGPGAREAMLVVKSSDVDEPEVRVPVSANVVALPPCNLRVTPSGQLQFGALTAQVPTSRQLIFENLSPTDVCLLSDLAIEAGSHPAFALRAGPVAEKELLPGARWAVEVTALTQGGAAGGTITGTVRYTSSSVVPEGSVQLVASLDAACLTIAPIEADVGSVKLGCASASRVFQIYNSCPSTVVLRDLTLLDAAGFPAGSASCPTTAACPEFAFTQRPTLPLTLNAGVAPVTFSVGYRPVDNGPDLGAIAVGFDLAGQGRTQLVSIRGEGAATGLTTDVFRGSGVPKVDILFVIDGSCSMSSKQQSLASNLPSFFSQALGSAVDYHLSVIVGQGPPSYNSRGRFLFGPTHPAPILTRQITDAEQQFATRVTSIGSNGGNEECFQPAVDALTPPLSTGGNAGFMRNDAQLAIVCVTDDSDYSNQPVSFYQAALTNLKAGRPTDVSLSAIAGYTQRCSATQLENGRYAQMTAATGGVREEICTSNWAQSLSRIAQTTFGETGRFFLRATPDLARRPVEVRVDGVPVAATSTNGPVWRYDTAINAVTFETLYRPPAGALVEVSYEPGCF